MWNKRPEEELPMVYDPSQAGGAPAGATPNPTEVRKAAALMFPTPTGKTDFESSSKRTATIGTGVKIVGEIYSSEDLFIEGFVQGTVEALNQKLTVGQNGTLHACVQVRELDVQGNVQGDVDACERVDVRNNSKLVGNIRAARINIEDGAYFKGNIDIVTPEAPVKPQLASRATVSASLAPGTETELELQLSG